jgi:small subunit ribosomal protein S8
MAKLSTVEMPHSKLKSEVARLLKREGYIADYTTESQEGKRILRLYLKYDIDENPVIAGLKRISKPGRRLYVNSTEVPRVLGGIGTAILSTSAGVMTDKDARRGKVGGEVLCYIW